MPCVVTDGTFFKTTERPPIRFADPGRICIAVTPPAKARVKPGSCGQTEFSLRTSGVDGFVASLPSLVASLAGEGYTPRCEWMSMMPGVTNLPFALITTAPGGSGTFAPMAV